MRELLPEVARLEAFNQKRRDAATQKLIQYQIAAARRQLHRAASGAMALPLALTGVLANLQAMAVHNRQDPEPGDLVRQFAQEVEGLRLRTERLLGASAPPYPHHDPPGPAILAPRQGVLVATRDLLPPPSFRALLASMHRLAFGDEKVRLAREAAQAGVRLSCRHIAELMRTTGQVDEQVEIAAALYPLAQDPEAIGEILAVISLPADQERLRQRLAGP
ncbi:MAG: DUF4476 domain-containing protein [Myxococcales bacterium]|nr:DUF4476 domain-containing protein [Myxococcota bacterium]MDW8280779.1 DUF4476 domain-containing protein [Myxococcales bacterium]